jgi:esterase/lipase
MLGLLLTILTPTLFAQNVDIFDYKPTANNIKLVVHKSNRKRTIWRGSLKIKDPIEKNDLDIPFEYYQLECKAPLVIVFPSLAEELPPLVERVMANKLNKQGYHALIAQLVEDISDVNRPLTKIDDFFIRSTIAFRQVLDKMENRPEVDGVYAMGTSLGGIRASLALAVEPRLQKAVVLVAGGGLPGIMTYSQVKLLIKYREAQMKKLGLNNEEEFLRAMQEAIKIDPLDYAHLRPASDIKMIMASRDTKVPYHNQVKLWEAFGQPESKTLKVAHRIGGASFAFTMKKLVQFFKF